MISTKWTETLSDVSDQSFKSGGLVHRNTLRCVCLISVSTFGHGVHIAGQNNTIYNNSIIVGVVYDHRFHTCLLQ